MANVETVLIGA